MAAYWVQGVLSLTDLATSFYFKDLLHASPASLQVATSIAYLPWTLKPLYGFCTDTVPLLGRKRKSYLMLAALVATACFALLAILPASSGVWLALSITLAAAIALSDVVVDGLVVERSRGQPQARVFYLLSGFDFNMTCNTIHNVICIKGKKCINTSAIACIKTVHNTSSNMIPSF